MGDEGGDAPAPVEDVEMSVLEALKEVSLAFTNHSRVEHDVSFGSAYWQMLLTWCFTVSFLHPGLGEGHDSRWA